MADPRTLEADPTAIGGVVTPPFARLPDPAGLFVKRSLRLRAYAEHSDLKPFLLFLAGLADAQAAIQSTLAAVSAPEALARSRHHAMPPLDRAALLPDAALDATFDALFDAAAALDQPDEARAALGRIAGDRALRDACARTVLAGERPEAGLAEHAYAAAAVQVHMARLAATLDVAALVPVGTGACPACGGPPVSSTVVGWQGADGARYCTCALCATMWNVVRVKCTLCDSTKGITYMGVEGGTDTVKAETCDACHRYVKILQGQKDMLVDAVADDVGSLGLDMLMAGTAYRRGAYDPFLMGY
ncbi:formate dehydrogenase accessory protein FdhE [Lichenibacterium ramalinae]|uniref:Formate dehydrogenase accessory protein FdhE n=1 Tax=Lichenibacterium ramalinae TaxID=2316527 RepID=A0A4Q2RHB1_9HYPH|nr:formate dehydrogenase accessory protein FdhE [Lichenibacterium ramalinae]RYB06038.1 formate dehydrogenase accessory protein FdhE [Lichenibacterium ramalinae]